MPQPRSARRTFPLREPRSAGGRSSADRKREAVGILLTALGLFLGLSFVPDPAGRQGLVGPLGAASFQVLTWLFSWGGLLVPVLAVVWGVVLFRGRGGAGATRFSAVAGVGTLACQAAFALVRMAGGAGPLTAGVVGGGGTGGSVPAAGVVAAEIAERLFTVFGLAGALIVLGLGVLLTLVFSVDARPALKGEGLSAAAVRVGRAVLWTAGVFAAAAVWLVSWVGGLVGVLGVALGAARTRIGAARAGGRAPGDWRGAGHEGATAAGWPGGAQAGRAAGRSFWAAAGRGRDTEPDRLPELDPPGVPSRGSYFADLPGGPPSAARARSAHERRAQAAGRDDAERTAGGWAPFAQSAVYGAGDALPESGPAAPPWEIPLDLFDPPAPRDSVASERELQEQAAVLIRKLADFNVRGEVVRISSGPVITQFEVEPAPGVKVNQIANLADDLALAMRAQRIRIVAPIPGKGAVGIEIPNRNPEPVTIRELLASPAFRDFRGTLPIALGKEISGTPVVADLTRMPHLLIAGSTGSGKSVCINALLTSLLVRFSPASLRLILIDPKMLELSMYDDVPHLLHPVVTRARDAATALKWAVYEMERRFELLAHNAVRNVADFNARLRAGADLRGVDSRLGSADEPLRPLPYVVLVVDELADLMLMVPAEIEEPLARLAQKARAVGIHVVLATQRPSVNVLTGFIKANFPSRVSFQVASKTDSRTILDQNGAEALLGAGDMLFLPADRAAPLRIQGAYVSARETEALVERLRELGRARAFRERETIDLQKVAGAEMDGGDGERDELFFEAARIVIEHDQGSTSLLQRRLKVGYSRAARIIDQLEQSGIVGPAEGSKPREVRIGLAELAERQAGSRGPGNSPASRSVNPA